MSTIAKFVIEMVADPQGVRTGLAQAEGYLNGFAKSADKQLKLGASGATGGVELGNSILFGLQNRLAAGADRVREQLFRGILSPAKAREESGRIGQAMNLGILSALEGLRSKGIATPELEHLLISNLSDAGLKAGEAFAKATDDRIAAIIGAGEGIRSIGNKLSLAITAPVVGVAGLGIKEAVEGQADAARLQLAFGDATAEVTARLDALHDRFPAQRKGLEEMASSTSLLLRSIDIVGPKSRDMALGLTESAGALGLIRTRDPSEVLEKLQAGLRGATRGLGEFGIVIKQSSIAREAERLGLIRHGQALDETRRALAAYSLIQAAVAKQVGAGGNFNELAANQLRLLKRDAIEAAEALGARLLPAFTAIVRTLDGLVAGFAKLPAPVLDTILVVAGLAAAIGPLLVVLGSLAVVVGTIAKAFRAAAASEGLASFLTGLGSLEAFVAGGGPLLLGLIAVLGVVLAIRNAMNDSESVVAQFEASLAGLGKTKLTAIGDDLIAQLDRAHAARARLLEASKNPGALGIGGGGAIASQLSDVDETISVLEEKRIALGRVLSAANKKPAAAETFKLPPVPVDAFKELVSETDLHITQLELVNTRYAEMERFVASTSQLADLFAHRVAEQSPLVATLTADVDRLNAAIKSGTLSTQEKAKALGEVLKVQKQINDATSVTPALQQLSGFAGKQLGAIEDSGNIDALRAAYDDAAQTFTEKVANAVIPKTGDNLAAIDNFLKVLEKAGRAIDAATPLRGSPRTGAELAGDAGRAQFNRSVDSAQTSSAVARSAAGAEFSNIGLGFKRAANELQASFFGLVASLAPANLALGALDTAASVVTGTLSSVLGALNPLKEISTAVGNALRPITPVLDRLGAVLTSALVPVFQAFAPVLESLLPLFSAIFSVIGPILKALAPLFGAFVPILNALFPVVKLLGIVLTYLGQAIAITSGVIFKIIGAFATTIGGIIAAIGTFISHIPFLGGIGRDIRDFGNGIKNFGHGANEAADNMFRAADDFARARTTIEATTIDTAADSIRKLGDTADSVTSQLLNVPSGYKVAIARYESTVVASPLGGSATGATPSPSSSSGSSSMAAGGVTVNGDILVDARSMTKGQLFDLILEEGRTRARAAGKAHWSEVDV